MTKPRLVKVRALLYVLQHITKRGCAYFDTAPFQCRSELKIASRHLAHVSLLVRVAKQNDRPQTGTPRESLQSPELNDYIFMI